LPISVFLISNYRLVLCSLAGLITSKAPGFMLAGVADSLAQALVQAPGISADVVVLDIDSGADTVLTLINALHAASHAKILLLTRMQDHALEDKAILLGARGLVDRDATPELLLNAIQKINAGQVWLNHEATGRVFVELSRMRSKKPADAVSSKVAQLTDREHEIVAYIARSNGDPGKTIAGKLHISESTLRNHLTAIYDKLGVANRHGLLAYAFQNGLTERVL